MCNLRKIFVMDETVMQTFNINFQRRWAFIIQYASKLSPKEVVACTKKRKSVHFFFLCWTFSDLRYQGGVTINRIEVVVYYPITNLHFIDWKHFPLSSYLQPLYLKKLSHCISKSCSPFISKICSHCISKICSHCI